MTLAMDLCESAFNPFAAGKITFLLEKIQPIQLLD
jgi:hypothetical protein